MNKTKDTKLILVGGFLGAGKTTLLNKAAHILQSRGLKVGLITNDQASELVDTALLSHEKLKVQEVSGSCFCCNFNGFADAFRKIKEQVNADVILAEPVGSCTDLSATILQPLKDQLKDEVIVSPLSVMSSPDKLNDILDGGHAGLHPSAAYIYRKQLEESDIILISKSDQLSSDKLVLLKEKLSIHFPGKEVKVVSSANGTGLNEWIDDMITRNDSGKYLVDVDYDVYAEGEAVLGWLNATIQLSGTIDWNDFLNELTTNISKTFADKNASIGHLKMLLECENRYIVSNLTGDESINTSGNAGTGKQAKLTLNARVEISPIKLSETIQAELDKFVNIDRKILAWNCLSPGRPEPTFRYAHIVR